MFEGFNLQHVRIVGRYWVRFSVRTGGGLMALFLALTVGLTVAHMFIGPVEQLVQAAPELGHTEGEAASQIDEIAKSDQIVEMVGWLTSDQDQASYLLREQPALLSVPLFDTANNPLDTNVAIPAKKFDNFLTLSLVIKL